MPITAEYLRDNRICVVTFPTKLDLRDYFLFVRKEHAAVYDHATKPIHAIIDLSAVKGLPRGVLSQAMNLSRLKHRMDGTVIFVSSDPVNTHFLEIFLQLLRQPNYLLAKTKEEAMIKIEQILSKEVELSVTLSGANR